MRRLYQWILSLAPEDFRERYRHEFMDVHAQRARDRRPGLRGVGFDIREIIGAVGLVLRLHVGGLRVHGKGSREGRTSMMETLVQDVRFAVRSLRRNPGFAATAVLVLALGIGANTAIFSAANAFFFRPLPFAEADRLVSLFESNPEFGWTHENSAPANVFDWEEQVEAFEDVGTYASFTEEITWISDEGDPTIFSLTSVSGDLFDVLGVRPHLGRIFHPDETWAPDDGVVVLSHALWTREFGADPGVIGRTLSFGEETVEIVGVMPRGFTFPTDRTELWKPWGWQKAYLDQVWFRRAHWVFPVARLTPDVTPEEANAQLQVVVQRLSAEYPETNRVMGAGLMPVRDFLTMDVRTPLLLLGGAVGILLLLACVNVANLVLIRGAGRTSEVALRHALGAGRGRVLRLMLTESFVLAGTGGLLGLAGGWAGVRMIQRFSPLGITGLTELTLDARVVLFVVGVSVLSGTLFGVLPALRSSSGGVRARLQARGQSGAGGGRLVNVLVGAEVALALLLVVGAGLLVRSFWILRDVHPGFTTEGTMAVKFEVPEARYENRDQVLAFYDRLIEALEARPGISKAGLVAQLPLNGFNWSSQFQAEGWPPDRVGFEIQHRPADEGYFEVMGIPLRSGRMFGPADRADATRVVLINETLAETYFPGEDPVGQRIAYDRAANENPDDNSWWEIVGVVADQYQESLAEAPKPEVFENGNQNWGRERFVVVRTDGEPLAALPAVRSALMELDPLIPISEVKEMRQVWSDSLSRERFLLMLLSVFGVVALMLSAVGVYGVTAQAARTRTREIGIRMALGAEAGAVVRLMVRQSLSVVGVGLTIGVVGALLGSRALTRFLYGIEPRDPGTITAVVALLGVVAAIASYLPARRATAVDPVSSLRSE